ncbi:hypothetical protein L3i20_v231480 [Paenibacillus sp. L3-i20]|nr:hypothetical protein L3i20_v231480 [Paenibacillus sp. L3-i20]
MYVCKSGHMAIRKARTGKKGINENQKDTYMFDIGKCKICPMRDGCYREGAKSKTFSVTIKSTEHKEQEVFQNSDDFKEKSKERYKIEEKNSELKHRHGYDVASSSGLNSLSAFAEVDGTRVPSFHQTCLPPTFIGDLLF